MNNIEALLLDDMPSFGKNDEKEEGQEKEKEGEGSPKVSKGEKRRNYEREKRRVKNGEE